MPHVVILYSGNLEAETDVGALCRSLAATMRELRDDAGQPVFPIGGIRVLAYPAAHHAVADGEADRAFCYLNLRMGRGRTAAVQQRAGEALAAATRAHFAPLLARRALGLTLQVDEGPEVFDAKLGNLHDLFRKP
jgi:5-carboxymethyl-2-hydroxymuconate isomerase